jgi:hypothetical protein
MIFPENRYTLFRIMLLAGYQCGLGFTSRRYPGHFPGSRGLAAAAQN